MQFLADILGTQVDRPTILETTALGAAWLAGSRAGVLPDMPCFTSMWRLERSFKPMMPAKERERRFRQWQKAVAAVLGYARANGEEQICS